MPHDEPVIDSAGGVVIARDEAGRAYVALVLKADGSWVLPKGHREPDESVEETALREVGEETGLDGGELSLGRSLGSFDLNEHDPDSGIPKLNHFFLMEFRGSRLPQLKTDDAHEDARWHRLPLGEIRLAYPYQRDLLVSVARDLV